MIFKISERSIWRAVNKSPTDRTFAHRSLKDMHAPRSRGCPDRAMQAQESISHSPQMRRMIIRMPCRKPPYKATQTTNQHLFHPFDKLKRRKVIAPLFSLTCTHRNKAFQSRVVQRPALCLIEQISRKKQRHPLNGWFESMARQIMIWCGWHADAMHSMANSLRGEAGPEQGTM